MAPLRINDSNRNDSNPHTHYKQHKIKKKSKFLPIGFSICFITNKCICVTIHCAFILGHYQWSTDCINTNKIFYFHMVPLELDDSYSLHLHQYQALTVQLIRNGNSELFQFICRPVCHILSRSGRSAGHAVTDLIATASRNVSVFLIYFVYNIMWWKKIAFKKQ